MAYTVREIAERLGTTESRIYQLVRAGRIPRPSKTGSKQGPIGRSSKLYPKKETDRAIDRIVKERGFRVVNVKPVMCVA